LADKLLEIEYDDDIDENDALDVTEDEIQLAIVCNGVLNVVVVDC